MWRCTHVYLFLILLIKLPDNGSDLLKQDADLRLALECGVVRYTYFLTYSMEQSSS